MRKKVFICSPFRGNMEGNARKAAAYSRMACEEGYLPIAPHLLFPQFLNEGIEEERRLGITMGVELLALCDEVWVFGEATEGMAAEIASATGQGGKLQRMSEVRAVLAEKANAGHTAEVKALIKGRGAGRGGCRRLIRQNIPRSLRRQRGCDGEGMERMEGNLRDTARRLFSVFPFQVLKLLFSADCGIGGGGQ